MRPLFSFWAVLLLVSCVEEANPPARHPAPRRRHDNQLLFNGSGKELFDEVARSLVGAHEALGQLARSYDVDGDCGGPSSEDGCYIWRFRSTNPSLRVMLTRFRPDSVGGAAGDYEGFVHFVDRRSRRLQRIDLKLRYADDGELNVQLSTRELPARGTNS
jgi:hypothetical protein